jgi:cellulose synthase/poly-beta-1,6-N-acetylglucosamine synthase-like glycosyltransferase
MISNLITYVFLFCSLYFEVFLLITYIEKRKTIKTEYLEMKEKNWPSVDVVVPCFNESKTIIATINSLLDLNYPKDKLKIMVVDDGSTDDSLKTLELFKENIQVEIHHKENGGKYTALNFAIENSHAELFGCLDADSFVDKDALKNMLPYFENEKIMAVVPSIKVYEPGNILQKIQKIEYGWGIFVRKVLTYLNALHVTPGPLTVFRKKIFDNIGKYKHAHQTEDLEMALRMQKHNYKIANSHRSIVYTVTPKTIKTLYKQRRRWSYGFLKNAIDYKFMFFKKEYGNLGFFILPLAVISIFSAIYLATNFVISNGSIILEQIEKIKMVGISFNKISFDWFYLNTSLTSVIAWFTILGTLTLVLLSIKLSEGKLKIKTELFYFLFIYPIIAPFWLFSAVFNTIFSKTITWR